MKLDKEKMKNVGYQFTKKNYEGKDVIVTVQEVIELEDGGLVIRCTEEAVK